MGTNAINALPIRSPKSLVDLCVDTLCRSLPFLDGALPKGLPQDVVEDIVHSLYDHSALNASTLRALRKCELTSLSLAGCRGVTDDWLTVLGCDSDEFLVGEDSIKNEDQFSLDEDEDSILSTSSFLSADQEPAPSTSMNVNDDEFMDTSQHSEEFQLSNQQIPVLLANCLFAASLRSLTLRGCQFISDNGLLQLGSLFSLREADLSGCHSLTGKGLLVLAESYDLTTLSLANCRRLGDEGIVRLTHLDSLKQLNLSGCRCISDQSLVAISHLHSLRSLDLSLCDQITDDGLSSLSTLEMISELRLGWCRQVTNTGLRCLAAQPARSSRLRVLHVPRLPITDECLTTLVLLSALEELDISGCTRLSSSAVGNMLSHLYQMTNLMASHCPGILYVQYRNVFTLSSSDI